VGIEVTYDRLPFPSVVLRFARAFQFDPLRMISSGTLAVTLPPDQIDAVSADLCEKDDLVRMWTLYPWDYCLLE